MKKLPILTLVIFIISFALFSVSVVFASTPSAGGDTTVVKPSDETSVSINEDAAEPESANIKLIVPTLSDPGGGTPTSIRILSIIGGTMKQSDGSSITLGATGTILALSSSKISLRFKPTSNRDTNATFQYVVVDPHDTSNNSAASTATIPITAVNDPPLVQTLSGSTGTGLAATYYTQEWDLTGSTFNRLDSTVNFSNNFNVSGMNNEQFSVRWTGKVESPITGDVTFSTQSDDGVRLWVNDELIIDNWTLHGTTTDTASPVSLVAGTKYNIRMEFYERGGGEVAILQWAYSGQSTQVIPTARLFPGTVRPAMTFINGSSAVVIDDAIEITDVDSTNIATASAQISGNFQSGEDSLQFTNQNGITGSYSNGTLSLSGTATVAQYQTALRSIKYNNSDSTPTTSTRTVRFKVYDGNLESNFVFRDIEFSATNTAPVITEGTSTSVTMSEDGSPTAFSLTLNATDADEHSISWSISSQASHGTASAGDPGNSVTISYTPTTDYFGSDSFVVQASDGVGGTDTITINVTIESVDDPTPTPTPTTAVTTSSSSSSSSTSNSTSTECMDTRPGSAPDLFQVSTSPTTATVYFTPVTPTTGYIINYGENANANTYAASFDQSSSGVITYTIKSLSEGTVYYFKVQAKNGCKTGDWSTIKSQTTTSTQPIITTTNNGPTPTPKKIALKVEEPEKTNQNENQQEPNEKTLPTSTPSNSGVGGEGYNVEVKVEQDGKPIAGATVELHSVPRRTTTDENGIARFAGVEKGEHTVKLAYADYQGEQKVSVQGDTKNVNINISIQMEKNAYLEILKSAGTGVVSAGFFFLFFLLWKKRKKRKN